MPRYVDKNLFIDYDEKYATASALHAATTELFRFRVKPGKAAWLTFTSNAIQAGGGDLVTFKLLVNGAPFYPFDGTLNQWAPPESNYDLAVPYELPVGCEISVIATNSDLASDFAATARVRVSYTDFPPVDVYR